MADPSRANATLIDKLGHANAEALRRPGRCMYPLLLTPSTAAKISELPGILRTCMVEPNQWVYFPFGRGHVEAHPVGNIWKLRLPKLNAIDEVLRDLNGFVATRVMKRAPSNVMSLWTSLRMMNVRPLSLLDDTFFSSEQDEAMWRLPLPGGHARINRTLPAPPLPW